MNGTEKQIKWAEQIKEKTLNTEIVKKVIEHAQKNELNKITAGNIDELKKFVAHLENCDDAKWWIDNREIGKLDIKGIAIGGLNYKLEEI